jgi:hypothetical protein
MPEHMKQSIVARSCCTTPSAACFWGATALLFYGAGLGLGAAWPAIRAFDSTLLLVAMGGACVINYARNRTLHCVITAPVFLVATVIMALSEARIWRVSDRVLWGFVLVAVAIAFLIEWRTVGGRPRTADA